MNMESTFVMRLGLLILLPFEDHTLYDPEMEKNIVQVNMPGFTKFPIVIS